MIFCFGNRGADDVHRVTDLYFGESALYDAAACRPYRRFCRFFDINRDTSAFGRIDDKREFFRVTFATVPLTRVVCTALL